MSHARRTTTVRIAAVATGVLLGAALLGPGANAATPCVVRIDGRDASTFVGPAEALAVTDVQHALVLAGEVPAGTTAVEVRLLFWPLTVPVSTPAVRGGGSWSAAVEPSDYEKGVGLYHVEAATNTDCSAGGWIRIVGNPLATLAGRLAVIAIAFGGLVQLWGVLRGSWWSVFGGLATGAAIALLLQQSGTSALELRSVVLASGSAAAVGGISHALLHKPAARQRAFPRPSQARPQTASPGDSPVHANPSQARPAPASPGQAGAAAPPPAAAAGSADDAGITLGKQASGPPSDETPSQSFALLSCDTAVLVGQEFPLTVGLAAEATPGVTGDVVRKPSGIVGSYQMTIHVVADGFDRRADENWRQAVAVTSSDPYPQFVLHLKAQTGIRDSLTRTIKAYYSVAGEPVGFAERDVAVVQKPQLQAGATAPPPGPRTAMMGPTGAPADLVLHISISGSESTGQFLAVLETRFDDIPVPDAPFVIDLGGDADTFARQLANLGGKYDGTPGLYREMIGLGKRIGNQLDDQFYVTLRKVYERVGKPPTLLISTEEPYVPWELAVAEGGVLDKELPPFLGAQVVVGRWVPGRMRGSHAAKPPPMPPAELPILEMAVIWGTYANAPLVQSELEAHEIATAYHALEVEASSVNVLRCVAEGQPAAQLLHFALHGQYDPGGTRDGLFLIDGNTLDANQVLGSELMWAPFVFLNACQVGTAAQVLGDYAGLANAFLRAGASGVIAPLWSVQDQTAREIALRFYAQVFADTSSISPAEALRRERANFKNSHDLTTATFLAYQYYGHPALRFTRVTPPQ